MDARLALLRMWFLSLGLVVLAWSVIRLYSGAIETPLRSVAGGIGGGQTYNADTLSPLEPMIFSLEDQGCCNPEYIRSAAVIRVRQAEVEWQNGASDEARASASRARAAVRTALAVSPSDAFLWYALAWIIRNQDGYGPIVARYLELSYATGPNEGWIAVHRNGFAVGLLPILPHELRTAVLAEFQGLVESGYIEDSASILTGPGWARREDLLHTLVQSPELVRAQLARRLVNLGFDVPVPGIDRSPARPWN